MPYSHHSHSGEFCKHASGRLEDVVREAIRQGFALYSLTEHVPRHRLADRYPEEDGMSVADLEAQFAAFLAEAHRLQGLYAPRITLLVGAETELITDADVAGLDALLARHGDRIEFLVGSVHHVGAIPIDFDLATFTRALESCAAADPPDDIPGLAPMERLLCKYFDSQHTILQRFCPEIVGHIDLCRLYNPKLALHDYPEAWAKLERNIRFAIGYGALFEFNAAAFRKGWDTAYPGRDVVELIRRLRGRFALSDDSHGPHAVGLNYDRLYAYLRELGIDELWYLEKSVDANESGRHLVPARVAGDWWRDEFWQSRSAVAQTV